MLEILPIQARRIFTFTRWRHLIVRSARSPLPTGCATRCRRPGIPCTCRCHIYYRVGRYLDAFSVNKSAVAVDETYLSATDAPMGVYRLGYYPHNVHFMMAAAQMAGDGAVVIAAAEEAARPHTGRGRARHRA